MTPEQHARCATLSKRIAELADPDSYPLGLVVWEPTPSYTWQHYRRGWWRQYPGTSEGLCLADCPNPLCGLRLAVANGPDHTDSCTLGALLLSLGDEEASVVRHELGWYAGWKNSGKSLQTTEFYETREEAILAAKVEQLEARDAK